MDERMNDSNTCGEALKLCVEANWNWTNFDSNLNVPAAGISFFNFIDKTMLSLLYLLLYRKAFMARILQLTSSVAFAVLLRHHCGQRYSIYAAVIPYDHRP